MSKSSKTTCILVIAFLMGLLAFAVRGETLEARQDADWIRITEAPCTDPGVASHVDAAMYAGMHGATAFVGGRLYNACWIQVQRPEGDIIGVIYEDGDTSRVPVTLFHEPKTA